MKQKIFILATILLCIPGFLHGQAALNQYLLTAAENNPALKAQFNSYMAALEKVPQAGALPDPNLAFGYFIQPIETRLGPQQAKIAASQMFPWFGSLGARKNTSESMAKAEYQKFEESKSKLFYEVKAAYYSLYFAEKAIGITLENLDILSSFKDLAYIKLESGSASALDAYRVEMEINELENHLALLRGQAHVLKVKFNKLLHVADISHIELEDLPLTSLVSKQNELDSLWANNNALSVLGFQAEALEGQKLVAQKEGMPQISLGLEYALVDQGNSTASNAGQDAFVFPKIGISIPLYRSKYKAMVQETVYLQEAKGFQLEEKENSLKLLFESTWEDYSDAERRQRLYQAQSELANKSLIILESNYATSDVDFEEVLRMERKALKYSLSLVKARTDQEAAVAFIRYLQGK